jgi:hypothetical protein
MSNRYPNPHEINEKHGEIFYRCRICQSADKLHWYGDTSCPVCSNPTCTELVKKEYTALYTALLTEETRYD